MTINYSFFDDPHVHPSNIEQNFEKNPTRAIKRLLTRENLVTDLIPLTNLMHLYERLPASEIYDYTYDETYNVPHPPSYVDSLIKFEIPCGPDYSVAKVCQLLNLSELLSKYTDARILPELLVEAYENSRNDGKIWPLKSAFEGYEHHLRHREIAGIKIMRKCLRDTGLIVPDEMCKIVISMDDRQMVLNSYQLDAEDEIPNFHAGDIIDLMGVYEPSEKRIIMYMPLIRAAARRHKLNTVDVFLKVLLHEVAHYYMHSSSAGASTLPAATASSLSGEIHESWANFFSYYALFVMRTQTNFQPSSKAAQIIEFQKGLKSLITAQPRIYRLFEADILNKGPISLCLGDSPETEHSPLIKSIQWKARCIAETLPKLIDGKLSTYVDWKEYIANSLSSSSP